MPSLRDQRSVGGTTWRRYDNAFQLKRSMRGRGRLCEVARRVRLATAVAGRSYGARTATSCVRRTPPIGFSPANTLRTPPPLTAVESLSK
ncbi:unnamed protein product, partial [Iphiclides podalirius]